MKKAEELRKKSPENIKKLIASKRQDLQKFYFNLAGSRAKNVKEGRNIRKDIARLHTITREISAK